MDIKTKNLVAAGSAAAVNCRPCLDYLVPQCIRVGATDDDIRAAIETGFQVSRNARAKTRGCIDEILTNSVENFDRRTPKCRSDETVAQTGCC